MPTYNRTSLELFKEMYKLLKEFGKNPPRDTPRQKDLFSDPPGVRMEWLSTSQQELQNIKTVANARGLYLSKDGKNPPTRTASGDYWVTYRIVNLR